MKYWSLQTSKFKGIKSWLVNIKGSHLETQIMSKIQTQKHEEDQESRETFNRSFRQKSPEEPKWHGPYSQSRIGSNHAKIGNN